MKPTRNELILEDSRGMRHLVSAKNFFLGWEEAERWVRENYKGHKLLGIQESIFGEVRYKEDGRG